MALQHQQPHTIILNSQSIKRAFNSVKMPLAAKLPSTRRLLLAAVALLLSRIFYKFSKWMYHVLTSVDRSKQIRHNCIPPTDFKHTTTQQETLQLVKERYPQLVDMVENGNLVAVQPRKMLAELLAQRRGQDSSEPPEASSNMRHSEQLMQEETRFSLTPEDVRTIVESGALQACMASEVPDLMFFVGTVHVSKQSAEDVKRVLQALHPSFVVIELCQDRMRALLMDPYADPLHDLEPCPRAMARHTQFKHKSVPEILKAAMSSKDHNVLTAMMGGLYSQLEDKLEVRAGVEFIAARQTLIEMLQEQELQQRLQEAGQPTAAAAARGPPSTWLQHCVPGDRPVMDTLLGLWGSLGPWRRLRFIGDLLMGLMSGIDEETIASLGKEDMVEMLLKEFSDAYPEVMRPLLHDRNWVLATNTWQVAQQAERNAAYAAEEAALQAAQGAGDLQDSQQGNELVKAAPVVAIVGKGHLSGMVYVVQWLVEMVAKAGGKPVEVRLERQEQTDAF